MTDIWKQTYENVVNEWVHVIESANLIKIGDHSADDKVQILRMKKLITHLDSVIQSIDPQLLSQDTLNDLHNEITNCYPSIKGGNFSIANQCLDNIATHLGAFHLASITKTESIKKFAVQLRKHSDTVNEIATEGYSKSENLLNEINKNNEEMNTIFGRISQFYKDLFEDNENRRSSRTRILGMEAESKSKLIEIQKVHEKLFKWKGEGQTVVEHIEKLHETVSKKIKNTTEELAEIDSYHTKIFGEKNEQGELEGGLKQEIEARKGELSEFNTEQSEIISALREQIEGLLPGATSAGLASAYKELKDEAHKGEVWFRWFFVGCVVALIAFGVFLFFTIELQSLSDWGRNILSASPIVVPLALLIGFFSKRRSEQHRLKQEYAHKEALAKSYDSFKQQVDALAGAAADENKKEILLNHLMKIMIDEVGFNAAKTLDKNHGDDMPSKNPVNSIIGKTE